MNKLFRQTHSLVLVLPLLIIIHLLILFKIQFIAWPEMFSYPYLIGKNYLLYRDIINPYPPFLTFFLFFFFNLFGFGITQLKILTFIIIGLTDILIFLSVKKFFNFSQAILTLILYIIWQPILEGNGLWFDLSMTPLLVLSFYLVCLLEKKQKRHFSLLLSLLIGIILGVAFLIKQTAALICLSIGLYLYTIFKKKLITIENIALYLLGLVLPILGSFLIMIKLGLIWEYVFWVYQYPLRHIQSLGFLLLPTLKQFLIIFLIIIIPLLSLLIYRSNRKIIDLAFWFLPSIFFAVPRFSYFHLQPVLPFTLILTAYFLNLKNKTLNLLKLFYLTVTLFVFAYFYHRLVGLEPRFYDCRTLSQAKQLREELQDKGYIYFYNLSSEYFVIADLLPSKPWADIFPWYLETSGLQEKIIDSLTELKVNFVVSKAFSHEGNYVPGSYQPKIIDQYIKDNFQQFKMINTDLWILKRNNLL